MSDNGGRYYNPITWVRELGGLGLAAMVLVGLYMIVNNSIDKFVQDIRHASRIVANQVEDELRVRQQALEELREQTSIFTQTMETAARTREGMLDEAIKQTELMQKSQLLRDRMAAIEERLAEVETRTAAINEGNQP